MSGSEFENSASSSAGDSPPAYEDITPVYTAQEIGAIFLDFYQFLTTLHYDPADLKVPPASGWPDAPANDVYISSKSDFTKEVLRHLPHLASKPSFHYKSHVLNHVDRFRDAAGKHLLRYEHDQEFWCVDTENSNGDTLDAGMVPNDDVLLVVEGHESYGRQFYLLTKHGQVVEEMLRADTLEAVDIREFFDNLKQQYRSLELIPGRNRVTIQAEDASSPDGAEVSLKEIEDSSMSWGTDRDIQYLKQLYRRHGWPESFDRDKAWAEVDTLMETIMETRGNWESEDWY